MEWKYSDALGECRRRDGEVWSDIGVVRKFRSDTHKYVDVNVELKKALDSNPNDPEFVKSYNKWIYQLMRRNTGKVKVKRTPWTREEREAIYDFVNEHVQRNSVDKWTGKLGISDLKKLAGIATDISGNVRDPNMVRVQLRSAANKDIANLKERAVAMAADIKAGNDILRDEQYPRLYIDISFQTV
jgi:hypothetical protein